VTTAVLRVVLPSTKATLPVAAVVVLELTVDPGAASKTVGAPYCTVPPDATVVEPL
jgi:hypothetical protein